MLALFFIAIAAIFNAVMDRLDNPYQKHIFPTTGPFWVKGTSKKWLNWLYLDAWHISKLILLFLVGLSPIVYKQLVSPFVDFVLFMATWGLFFELAFYLFKKTK